MKVEGSSSVLPAASEHRGQNNTKEKTAKTKESNQKEYAQNKRVLHEKDVFKAIEMANISLELPQTMFEFSIHEKTREIMVKVIDEGTGEVIREIPPEKILDMVAKMWEIAGILVDEKV